MNLNQPGTYLLLMELVGDREIEIGRRRHRHQFAAGHYCYVGSALGPGGLNARLRRHASADKRMHWHIDYFLDHARLMSAIVVVDERRLECKLSRWVAGNAETCIGGIGASDCNCPSHLFYLGALIDRDSLICAAAKEINGRHIPVGAIAIRQSPD